MQYRMLAFVALAALTSAMACSEDDTNSVTAPTSTATVRFVNATGSTDISVATNGTIASGNSALGFGGSSTCMTVNTTGPGLAFTNSSTGASINGFTPNFVANGNYMVIAYSETNGNTRFATLDDSFTPAAGQVGLRIFNAAPGAGSVVLNSNGTAIKGGTVTDFGTAGNFFSTPAGSFAFSFNRGTGTSNVADLGTMSLAAGQTITAIVGPAATGSPMMRGFFATGC